MKPQIGVLSNGIDMMQSVENEFFCLIGGLCLSVANAEIADFATNVYWSSSASIAIGQRKCLFLLPQRLLPGASYRPSGTNDGGPIVFVLDMLQGSDRRMSDRLAMRTQIFGYSAPRTGMRKF
jgi:serine/threonine-protein kinase HipA